MKKTVIISFLTGVLSVNAALIGHFTATDGVYLDGSRVTRWENLAGGSTVLDILVEFPENTIYDASSTMDSGRPGILWDRAGRAPLIKEASLANVLDFSAGGTGNTRGLTVIFAFEPLDLSAENNIIGVKATGKIPNLKINIDPSGIVQVMLNDSVTTSQNIIKGSIVQAGQTVVAGFTYAAKTGQVIYWDSLGFFSTTKLPTNAIFAESQLYFPGSAKKAQETDGIFGELRIYDEALVPSAFGAACREMVCRWVESGPIPKPPPALALAQTLAQTSTPAPALAQTQTQTSTPAPAPAPAQTLTQTQTPPPAPAPGPAQSPAQISEPESESAQFAFGLIIAAPILLLMFRRF